MNQRVRSEHPIDDTVRDSIMRSLHDIETTHDVTVLFACESGSRAWGFASPDSDYDVRFLYVHRLPWYLRVEAHRDVIELLIEGVFDVNGWDLRKALQLLLRSNPVLLEWLSSPVVYCENRQSTERLRELAETHFSPLKGYHHYLAMARKNFCSYLQGESVRLKKYLYVLRPLLAARWIDARMGQPPMRFADLVDGTLDDDGLITEIDRLLQIKMSAGEMHDSPRWPRIHAFIEAELERPREPRAQAISGKNTSEMDRFLLETVLTHTDKEIHE